jgi:hypothetical protein
MPEILRTDITSATPRSEHPAQHNEVNRRVIALEASRGAAGGLATLDMVTGVVPDNQLPATAFTTGSQVVASQAAQLALSVPQGFIAIRSDQNTSYIRNAGTAGTMADWTPLPSPTDLVQSVNGQTGAVVLAAADVGGQPSDADLTAIAALAPPDDDVLQRKGGAWTGRTPAQLKADLALAKADVGLSNVANLAPADLPVSTAGQTALDAKQPADADLTAIAALAPPDDNVLQRKGGAWVDRTPAQLLADLGISGPTFLSSFKWGVDA